MAECEILSSCPFFGGQIKSVPGVLELYKRKYCKGNNSQCACYMVFKKLGKEKVPPNLFPNMLDKAKKIIEENK
jgi:hypothetical protein